ncbi:MAG: DNA polymerase III subunit alpha [Rhodobiaceae bacterium]|nr:DNA polymerase III subunit alpha [Rhodobiaceae bacterium]
MTAVKGGGPGFVHLRVRSAYSLLEGALPVKKLVGLAVADAMPAIAICDSGNLFGALQFATAAADAGVQPIIGTTLAVDMDDELAAAQAGAPGGIRQERPCLALLARDVTGYRNLMQLSSEAYLATDGAERPHVPLSFLTRHSEGLIALSGGPGGPVNEALLGQRGDIAEARLEILRRAFGDRLYIELQRHGLDEEKVCEPLLIDLAYRLSLPLVGTNDAFFAREDDFEAHDALLCIAGGALVSEDKRRRSTPEHWLKPRADMVALFADLPEAAANSVEIARRCRYWPRPANPMLPRFTSSAEQEAAGKNGAAADPETEELVRQAHAGLEARLAAHGAAAGYAVDDYRKRLDFELDVIARMKYSGYFLIVSDFIKWAKGRGIPVGPGRGSGAGSVVAWSLTITDLDPMRFGLLFERFLNPERVSMPDFDIDFCQERRDEVIEYVQQRYGADQVAQIITFGTLQARAVLRDVGRVLELRYGEVDQLAKMVPANPANPVSLAQAIDGEPRLQEARRSDPRIAQLLRISLRLEGLYRHASTHAAGIVIGDRPLREIVPLYRDPRSSMPVTQFSMKWAEQAGLVKFDFLGLKTLTVIDKTVKLLALRGVSLDVAELPLDDARTYELLASGETAGVFQVESSGMRDALKRMKPDRLEDIIALVALYRPGPMDNIPTYCNRKQGSEKPDYLHPMLQPILEETFGVIIYQEQVMQIAQVMSGYSLGEADLLRRAMGKKIKSEMDKQRSGFVAGAVSNGIEQAQAEYIFELIAKFADYGFNKSHAAAYALIAYQTAYLKSHYPVEFLTASMTLDINNTEKLNEFRLEALRLGIRVAPPSINFSGVDFRPDGNAIHYALAAVKTVGRQAVEHIVEERERGGVFRDLADFTSRISPRFLNRRAFENLAAAGAFDCLEPNRAAVVLGAEAILGLAASNAERRARGQNDLFATDSAPPAPRLPTVEPWLPSERLRREFEAVGFFLSGHPLDEYLPALRARQIKTWEEFQRLIDQGQSAARLAGTVLYKQERSAKSGNRFAFVGVSDPSGQYEAVVFADTLTECRELLEPGSSIVMRLEADQRDGDTRLRLLSAEPLDANAAAMQQSLMRVFIGEDASPEALKGRLPEAGTGEVALVVALEGGRREVEIRLPGRYRLTPETAGAFKSLPGVISVEAR